MEATVRLLKAGDLETFRELIHLFNLVFELPPGIAPDDHLIRQLQRSDFYVFVAEKGDQVVGGLTMYELQQYHSTKPLGYVYDLAVAVEHQRQGIGKQILSTARDCCRQKGFEEMYVQAEQEDQHAVDFYHSTTPSEIEVAVHFSYQM